MPSLQCILCYESIRHPDRRLVLRPSDAESDRAESRINSAFVITAQVAALSGVNREEYAG